MNRKWGVVAELRGTWRAAALVPALLLCAGCDDGRLKNTAFERYWAERMAGPAVGSPAPEYTLRLLDGDSLRLADLRGDAVLLNAWATWCVPCLKEMPMLQAVHERYGPLGLRVIGISVDGKDSAVIRDFAVQRGFAYPLAADRQSRLVRSFGWSRGIPKTLLIDRAGLVLGYWIGFVDVTQPDVDSLIVAAVRPLPAHAGSASSAGGEPLSGEP